MKKHILVTLATIPLAGFTAYSQWSVVDDFEDGDVTDWYSWNQQVAEDNPDIQSPSNVGHFEVVSDPYGDSSNFVAEYRAGDGVITDNAFLISKQLTDMVEDGESGTLYFRFAPQGDGINVTIGTTDVNPVDDTSAPTRWGLYQPILRYGKPEAGTLGARDKGDYESATDTVVTVQEWYEVWMVLNNNINFDQDLNPNGVEDTYKIYIKGGPWTEQTVLLTEDAAEEWVMRRSPTVDAISSILIIATTDSPDLYPGNDFLYLDDFYVTSGEQLSSPVTAAADWNGYPVVDGGWVDTDELGWVNIDNDPWLWSSSLKMYVYVGDIGLSGGWFYMPR